MHKDRAILSDTVTDKLVTLSEMLFEVCSCNIVFVDPQVLVLIRRKPWWHPDTHSQDVRYFVLVQQVLVLGRCEVAQVDVLCYLVAVVQFVFYFSFVSLHKNNNYSEFRLGKVRLVLKI